jgi:hypothetical protein
MSVTAYTIPDLIPILRMKSRAIRQLLTDGKLQGRIVGRQWLVPEESIKRFLETPQRPPHNHN